MEEKVLVKADFLKFKFLIAFLWTLSVIALIGFMIWAVDCGEFSVMIIGIVISILIAVYTLLLSYILKKRELIITNKRVISKRAFAFRKDIPLEKVTDVSTRLFMGIGCASPSSKIMYLFCKNKKEVFDTISYEVMRRDSKHI